MTFGSDQFPLLIAEDRVKWALEEIEANDLPRTTEKRVQAALLCADIRLTYGDVADVVGMSERTIGVWMKQRAFKQLVAHFREKLHEEMLEIGYGSKAKRIGVYSDIADRLYRAIQIRAENADPRLPETETGAFAREKKTVGYGKDSQIIEFVSVDTALLKELRATLEQISREEGQWIEQSQRNVTGEIPIRFQMQPLPNAEVDASSVTVIEVTDAVVTAETPLLGGATNDQ